MHNTLKRCFALLLVFVMALSLAGCQTTQTPSASPTATAAPSPEATPAAGITDGEYETQGQGNNGPLTVKTTIQDGKITSVKVTDHAETEGIFEPAVEKIPAAIVAGNTVNVDAVSGATNTGNGIIEAVKAAITKAGGNPADFAAKAETPAAPQDIEVVEYDVAVVGVGTSGTFAAVAAAETGAKTIAIEKNSRAGGSPSGGIAAVESSQQKAAGLTLTKDEYFDMLIKASDYRAYGPLVRRVADLSGDTIDWAAQHGLETVLTFGSDQAMHYQDSSYPKLYHVHKDFVQGWNNMLESFKKLGGELRLETRAESLIVDADGNVTGVMATKADGSKLQINAKSVILGAGGYGATSDKFKELLDLEIINPFGSGNTGDGIDMAVAIGAKPWGTHTYMLHNCAIVNPDGSESDLSATQLVHVYQAEFLPWVNPQGTRFVNERLVSNSCLWANAAYSQGGSYYTIINQATIDDLEKNGTPTDMWYIGVINDPDVTQAPNVEKQLTQEEIQRMKDEGIFGAAVVQGSGFKAPPITGLAAAMEEAAQAGKILKGDTLEDLAAAAGMSPENLKASMEQYNNAVKNKHDDLFFKPAEYLSYSMEGGPYYAIRNALTSLGGTLGGVMINENCEVLNTKYQPIKGLYAIGTNAGGMYGPLSTYPDIEGTAMMFAVNTGRIAGQTAGNASK